jgi:hypothetical protein
VALTAIAVLLAGCTVTNRLFRNTAAEERAASLLQVQLAVMRFADEYAVRIEGPIIAFQRSTTDPHARLASQSWLASQATAAFTIAAGPNPQLNAIDMLIFATLSRMVIEEGGFDVLHGERAADLLAAHRTLEQRIWDYSSTVLSEAQMVELRTAIDEWHRENPLGRVVPFIHLEDFAVATGRQRTSTTPTTSIFSFLGIDPLSNLDPAVREISQSRQLAERAVYYGQRAPTLIRLEAQRLAFELAVKPESVRLLDSVASVGSAAQTTSRLAESLPGLVAQERAAAIEQLTGVLDEREGRLRALVAELQAALEAGGTTSESVRATVLAIESLMARFERREPAAGARPFDITEYTTALRQLGETAAQLETLVRAADKQAPALGAVSGHAANVATSLVDHVFWRLVQLVVVLVLASVVGGIAYRKFARR